MTEREREEMAASLVKDIHSAATKLAILAGDVEDDDASNNYTDWCNWFRDWADQFFPPKENWGGDNIIRFPHERVG